MGLFPRYLSVIDKGGSFYIAKESAGAIGAVLSVIPDDCGEYRADFFFAEGFKNSINEMIELSKKKHGRIYRKIAGTGRKIRGAFLLRPYGHRCG